MYLPQVHDPKSSTTVIILSSCHFRVEQVHLCNFYHLRCEQEYYIQFSSEHSLYDHWHINSGFQSRMKKIIALSKWVVKSCYIL